MQHADQAVVLDDLVRDQQIADGFANILQVAAAVVRPCGEDRHRDLAAVSLWPLDLQLPSGGGEPLLVLA